MTPKQKFGQLTSLRYFAALLVFICHHDWSKSPDFLADVFLQGFAGVSFFYVLSGFVLSHSYSERIRQGSISVANYLLRRIARIGPLHLLTALPFVLLAVWKGDFDPAIIVSNLTLLHSLVPYQTIYFSLNEPSWSLSNELFFYVCFLSVVLLKPVHRYMLTALLFAVMFVSATMITVNGTVFFTEEGHTWAVWLFYINPVFRFLEFLTGMLIYDLWQRRVSLPRYSIGVAYGLVIVGLVLATQIPWGFRSSLYFLPIAAFFLLVHVRTEAPVVDMLSNRFLVLLGEASFALYLIHQPMIRLLEKLLDHETLPDGVFFAASLVIVTSLSVVVHLVFEKPVVAWLNRRIDQRTVLRAEELRA